MVLPVGVPVDPGLNIRRSISSSLVVLALLATVQDQFRRRAFYPIGSAVSPVRSPEAPELLELRNEGNSLFRAGQYLAAIRVYEGGCREARRRRDTRSSSGFSITWVARIISSFAIVTP